MKIQIECQYDSHCHLQYTGEVLSSLNLKGMKKISDLNNLEINQDHYREDWLYGFGWDLPHFPNRKDLDVIFHDTPVFFSRTDGHSSWLSTAGLRKLGLFRKAEELTEQQRKFLEFDEDCFPSGILKEDLHMSSLFSLPQWTKIQIHKQLFLAHDLFLSRGFTHVRDMTTSIEAYEIIKSESSKGNWKLHVDAHLVVERFSELEDTLETAIRLKKTEAGKTHSDSKINLSALKVFVDGSMGSGTAHFMSDDGPKGMMLWNSEQIELAIEQAWKNDLEISFHAIGDLSADIIIECARRVSSRGLLGRLNLEHAQCLSSATIQKMKSLHIHCHMQPCHFLSDRKWLKKLLGRYFHQAFPWGRLSRAKVPLFFGSDSPIEEPSIWNNEWALRLAEDDGLDAPVGEFWHFHRHPRWQELMKNPNTAAYTLWEVSDAVWNRRFKIEGPIEAKLIGHYFKIP